MRFLRLLPFCLSRIVGEIVDSEDLVLVRCGICYVRWVKYSAVIYGVGYLVFELFTVLWVS